MKLETKILNDFFELLNKNMINYCVMNNYIDMPEIIPSDVDFAISFEDYQKLDNLINYLATKHNVVITQKIWHGYNKCAYILSPLNIDNYFWLQLDMFVDFSGKGFPNLLPVKDMLNSKISYKNFFIPKPEIEVPFVFQRRIFKGDLELRHLEIMKNLYLKDEINVDKKMKYYFGNENFLLIKEIIYKNDIELFKSNYKLLRTILKDISNRHSNFYYLYKYYINQITRTIYRVYYPNSSSILITGDSLENLSEFSISIDNIISGSFHGTSILKCNSISSYIRNYLKTILIPKITKKKVYILVENDVYTHNKFLKLLKMNPDISINLKENNNLDEITALIMITQSNKTKKHLFSWLSPTSNIKVNNIND